MNETDPCCDKPQSCDHVWCDECCKFFNDTGAGPSCGHKSEHMEQHRRIWGDVGSLVKTAIYDGVRFDLAGAITADPTNAEHIDAVGRLLDAFDNITVPLSDRLDDQEAWEQKWMTG